MSASDARRPTISPVLLVVIAIASVQVGASFAKLLFGTVSPSQMVWLRLATSAVIFIAVTRPALRARGRRDWRAVAGLAACLGGMNWAIYESFARIPLGIAVTIEFVGPLTLAVLGSRRARDLLWVGLAAAGVILLGWEGGDLDPAGIALAFLAGAFWAGYIVFSAETGRRWAGIDGLAVASVLAAAALTPIAWSHQPGALLDVKVLAVGGAVGLLSSVIPYSLEITALRTIRTATFGILMSLEPAAAALAAMLVLAEFLSVQQWLAMALVVAASIGATRSGRGQDTAASAEPLPH